MTWYDPSKLNNVDITDDNGSKSLINEYHRSDAGCDF
jgi:hypothetical protein